MAAALACAVACACGDQPNDHVVDVQLSVDAGVMGSGGAPMASPGPTTPCALPDWYARASVLDVKEVGCRTPKDDPVVAFAEGLYNEQKGMLPPAGEGPIPSRCDFNWPSPYYQDPAYPDEYTFCSIWCGLLRYAAYQTFMQYDNCNKAEQMAEQMRH